VTHADPRTAECARCRALWLRGQPPSVSASRLPHPECLRHPWCRQADGLELQVGPGQPITALWSLEVPASAPHVADALPCNLTLRPAALLGGCGVADDPELARTKAVVEALERICACLPPRVPLRLARPAELGERMAPGIRVESTHARWWVEAIGIRDQQARLVPLEYVQLASLTTVPDPVVRANSTGMAVHPARSAAVENAIRELCERIGLAAMPCAPVLARWADEDLRRAAPALLDLFDRLGYVLHALPCPCVTNQRATLVLLIRRDGSRPALVAGAGAATTDLGSIQRAMLEAYAQMLHARELALAPETARSSVEDLSYHDNPLAVAQLLAEWCPAQARPHTAHTQGRQVIAPLEPLAVREPWLGVVDRGNALTHALGLAAVQAVAPEHFPSTAPPRSGSPHPLGVWETRT